MNVLLLLLSYSLANILMRAYTQIETITNPPQHVVFVREIENHHFQSEQARTILCLLTTSPPPPQIEPKGGWNKK
jgi:hypothetical protein